MPFVSSTAFPSSFGTGEPTPEARSRVQQRSMTEAARVKPATARGERLQTKRGWQETLFGWRTQFGFGWLEGAVLAVYCAILAVTIPFHEPWSDEAQAWLIARDSSLWDIYRHRMHYEGAPALWHTLLHGLVLLHAPYQSMAWMGACCAAAGIAVLLRWSPFPLVLRVLLPFTFWLQYQYGVVARGYVLFPLLLFALCALFRSRKHPVWIGLVAGLLANISLQGVVLSAVLLAMYLLERFQGTARTGEARETRVRPAPLVACGAVYGAFLLFCILVAFPAPDQVYANGDPVVKQTSAMHRLLMRFPGELPQAGPREHMTPVVLQKDSEELEPRPRLFSSPGTWAAWYSHQQEVLHPGVKNPLRALLKLIFGSAAEATWPLSNSRLLDCAFLLVLAVWSRRRGFLRGMLPWLLTIVVGERLWVADHHAGLLFLALLAALWLAYEHQPRAAVPARLDRALLLLTALVCLWQIAWTALCVSRDIRGSYDPGHYVALYLKAHPASRVAGFDFFTTSINPYFARTPFANETTSYWVWSLDNPDQHYQKTIASHPDLVVFSTDLATPNVMRNEWSPMMPPMKAKERRDFAHNVIVDDLRKHGYRETHRFCGVRYSRNNASYESCDVLFEPFPGR